MADAKKVAVQVQCDDVKLKLTLTSALLQKSLQVARVRVCTHNHRVHDDSGSQPLAHDVRRMR